MTFDEDALKVGSRNKQKGCSRNTEMWDKRLARWVVRVHAACSEFNFQSSGYTCTPHDHDHPTKEDSIWELSHTV